MLQALVILWSLSVVCIGLAPIAGIVLGWEWFAAFAISSAVVLCFTVVVGGCAALYHALKNEM